MPELRTESVRREPIPFLMRKADGLHQVPRHRHDFFEISYIYSGAGTVRIDGKDYKFRSGQCHFIPPFADHAVDTNGNRHQHRVVLCLGREIFARFHAELTLNAFADTIARGGIRIVDIPVTQRSEIESIIEAIWQEYSLRRKDYETMLYFELQRLLVSLRRIIAGEQPCFARFMNIDPRIYDALVYIEKNYYRIAATDDFARHTALEKKQFRRLFKKNVGMNPLHYLNRVRIEKACQDLSLTDRHISNIAFDCGFNDESSFHRQFRKLTGMPPLTFRERYASAGGRKIPFDRFSFPS